jgi:tripartite-type tricarboxylate transporter receptor subunit TctC
VKPIALAAAAAAVALNGAAFGQTFPSKPIRIVTQFAPGSSGDTALRFITPAMSESVGQPVVIDSRPGAGGVLAAELVMRSAPDGYTLLSSTSAAHIMRPFLVKNISFDPLKDFTPITQLLDVAAVIVANPSLPANNLRELLEQAKREPGKLSFGTSGVGSEHHLSAEQIMQLTGVKLVHVPYKAGSQAMLDVSAGQLPLAIGTFPGAQPLIASGKLKAIAVVSERRVTQLPNVATVSETVKGFEPPAAWTGIFGPAAMPAPLARRLQGEFSKALNVPDVKAKMLQAGYDLIGSTPEDFATHIRHEIEVIGKVVKAAGIKPE